MISTMEHQDGKEDGRCHGNCDYMGVSISRRRQYKPQCYVYGRASHKEAPIHMGVSPKINSFLSNL